MKNHGKESRCGFSLDDDLLFDLCIIGSNLKDKVAAAIQICGSGNNKVRSLSVG